MLRKRIIFTLIYSDGFFTQSRNFRLQKVGDLGWLEKHYQFQRISFSIDELIILNASKNAKATTDFASVVSQLTTNVFIPVAVGGGIRTAEDAALLFKNGADKIVLNSALANNPRLVKILIEHYGAQSVIASIDYKHHDGINEVFILDGTEKIDYLLNDYIQYVADLGVGEIYLNSIDQDGTGFGYDFYTINDIKNLINIPLIIAGGAGNVRHLQQGLQTEAIHAVATANLFNFLGDSLPNARKIMLDAGMNVATTNEVSKWNL